MLDKFICIIGLYLLILILWLDNKSNHKGVENNRKSLKGCADNIEEREEIVKKL